MEAEAPLVEESPTPKNNVEESVLRALEKLDQRLSSFETKHTLENLDRRLSSFESGSQRLSSLSELIDSWKILSSDGGTEE